MGSDRRLLPRLALVAALALAAGPAAAQDLSISLGGDGSLTATTVQLFLLITVLSLAPGIAIMVTCFPFIVTVLAILRQGIGLQQSPPNMLIVSLALFLTWFVMDPVFTEAWTEGLRPMLEESLPVDEAIPRTLAPFRLFMGARVETDTLYSLAALQPGTAGWTGPAPEAPLSILVPAFLLSEIERAFEIGFLVFLPFLIIDLVVAAILMSMGMMMVPPAIVSLPFKLAFFVVADGWTLVSEALVRSYLP
jgi:flagellar biosynthetic protein FliP